MAETQNKLTHHRQANSITRSSCFPAAGCFGFSRKTKPLDHEPIPSPTSRNKTRLLSWPMFRFSVRKSSRTKTVPVVDTTEKKAVAEADQDQIKNSHKSKLIIKKKSDTKLLTSEPKSPRVITNHKPSRQNSKVDQAAAATEKPKETRQPPEPKIILGNGKLLDRTRTGSSLPVSPTVKAKPKTNSTKLSHTVSLPVREKNKRVDNPRVHARINLEEVQRNKDEAVEKSDPLIGMSIIMMTLIIMLLWGRLCAILCTSAWFYFCPRFRTDTNNINSNTTVKRTADSNNVDLNSEEYKKKVVLEGLLERNRRLA